MRNPLFYRNVVALNSETHRDLCLKRLDKPLGFSARANLIPAIVDEFELAMSDLPIAFLPGESNPVAVFVAGLRSSENVFVTGDGLWDGRYVPAYLRRYPFILGDVPDGDPLLCIDESHEGFDRQEGDRLFSDTGEITETVQRALTLAISYRDAATRTEEFCGMLREMGLLKSVVLDATLPDGGKTSMHGLLIVDEEALNKLSPEQLHTLHGKGFLKAIYFHLASLASLDSLPRRARGEAPEEAGKTPEFRASGGRSGRGAATDGDKEQPASAGN